MKKGAIEARILIFISFSFYPRPGRMNTSLSPLLQTQ